MHRDIITQGKTAQDLIVERIDSAASARVRPSRQSDARSLTLVPVPASLIEQCAAQITVYGRPETLLNHEDDRQLSPWAAGRAMRKARSEVNNLPAGFRYHDQKAKTVTRRSTARTYNAGFTTCGYAV
jgi:hypothetical protein